MSGERGLGGLLETLASGEPAPGGGSAAAAVVAIAAALLEKVARVSREQAGTLEKAQALRSRAEALIEDDAKAYLAFVEAKRSQQDEVEARSSIIEVPLQIARVALEVVELAHELGQAGKPSSRPDATTSAVLAHAAITTAAMLIQVNVGLELQDPRLKEALELTRLASESVRNQGRASGVRPRRAQKGRG